MTSPKMLVIASKSFQTIKSTLLKEKLKSESNLDPNDILEHTKLVEDEKISDKDEDTNEVNSNGDNDEIISEKF